MGAESDLAGYAPVTSISLCRRVFSRGVVMFPKVLDLAVMVSSCV